MKTTARRHLASIRNEILKSEITEMVRKYNENHDERGRFTSGPGGGAEGGISRERAAQGELNFGEPVQTEMKFSSSSVGDITVPKGSTGGAERWHAKENWSREQSLKALDGISGKENNAPNPTGKGLKTPPQGTIIKPGVTEECVSRVAQTYDYLSKIAPIRDGHQMKGLVIKSGLISPDTIPSTGLFSSQGKYIILSDLVKEEEKEYGNPKYGTKNLEDTLKSLKGRIDTLAQEQKATGKDNAGTIAKIKGRLDSLEGKIAKATTHPYSVGDMQSNQQECVAAHEWGHAWHLSHDAQVKAAFGMSYHDSNAMVPDAVAKEYGMTKYGRTAFAECVAEQFAAHTMGYPNLVHPKFKELFDKEFKK